MSKYKDFWYNSEDGLKLYARDYSNTHAKLTLLCMHGLSRNSADFEPFSAHLKADYRLIVVDQRGRGRSDYDSNPQNYSPDVYARDMLTLIDSLSLNNVVLIGTSMGGLIAMIMNALRPDFFAGVVLNDVGPVIDPRGLKRIQSYVGKTASVANWQDAIAYVKQQNQLAFPDYQQSDWEKFAQRIFREDEQGIPQLCYDPAIATPAKDASGNNTDDNYVPPDLWPLFELLSALPCLTIRGELSDILSRECFTEMQRKHPSMLAVEVKDVGHAPMLDEPDALAAIKEFLKDIV